jgi:hypothetical protein
MIRDVPKLVCLDVESFHFNDALLESMTPHNTDQSPLCPLVEEIRVGRAEGRGPHSFTDKNLMDMVRSRTSHPRRQGYNLLDQPMATQQLKLLHFYFKPQLDPEIVLELDALRSSGLQVIMSGRGR